MQCPACRHPMELSQYVPGQHKVWTCNRCRATKRKSLSGYNGQLVMGSAIPVKHQE